MSNFSLSKYGRLRQIAKASSLAFWRYLLRILIGCFISTGLLILRYLILVRWSSSSESSSSDARLAIFSKLPYFSISPDQS